MTLREGFRCYIVGTESLLIQCADILLRAGHTVAGVVSSDQGITSWAAEHGIRVLPFDAQLAAALEADGPFDYLFSIANLKVLPDAVLRLPARGTINFHDGPLPRYAGLYTTTWALLRGERQYGVTWHEIAKGIDTGDILEQELFDLDPTETRADAQREVLRGGHPHVHDAGGGSHQRHAAPARAGHEPARVFRRLHASGGRLHDLLGSAGRGDRRAGARARLRRLHESAGPAAHHRPRIRSATASLPRRRPRAAG